MKKILTFLWLATVVLLCFTACGKRNITPTDANQSLSSAVQTETQGADQSEVSLVTSSSAAVVSQAEKASQVAVPSKTEAPKATANAVSFVQHKRNGMDVGVFWQYYVEPVKETSVFTKVTSAEQLEQVLTNYQLPSQTLQTAVQEYSASFFAQNTLLLIEWQKPDTSICLTVEEMRLVNQELQLVLQVKRGNGGHDTATSALYPVEIQGKLDNAKTIRSTVNYSESGETKTIIETL